ncbi:MAG: Gfo/Idh/MocA family oxidoreductase [Pseudomonadota bacterium]|nr:Gfo/Idh/MocA family oxidoreductase [Pseudomonadota bacterium]
MTNESPVRLGLVGVGKIARDQHLPAIVANPHFELVATADPLGHVQDIPGYASIEEMLAASHDLDAVSIATPPPGRGAIAGAAIDAGLDVMLEKPPAATLAEIGELEARAAAAGAILYTTWHSREAAGVTAARDWLENCRIKSVNIAWREDIRRWHPGQDWILAAGGFGVFDPGINALSIATAILPEPIVVESAELTIPAGRDSPIAANLRMRSGAAAIATEFDFLHEGPQQWDIIVETDSGRLALHEGGRIIDINGSVAEGPDNEYPRLYARFATMIRERQSDVDTAPLGIVANAFRIGSRREGPEFKW